MSQLRDNRDLALLRSLALPSPYNLTDDAWAHNVRACRLWLAESRLRLHVVAAVSAGAAEALQKALAAYEGHQSKVAEALGSPLAMPLLGPSQYMLVGKSANAAFVALARSALAMAQPGV